MNLQQALETCIRNQAECASYRGPEEQWAKRGHDDWLMEECLIRAELLGIAVEVQR